jgi:ribonuclease D
MAKKSKALHEAARSEDEVFAAIEADIHDTLARAADSADNAVAKVESAHKAFREMPRDLDEAFLIKAPHTPVETASGEILKAIIACKQAFAAHEEMAVKAAKIAEMANEARSDEFGRAYTTIVSDMVEDAGMYLTKIRSLARLFEICVAPRIRSLPERTPMTEMCLEEISNLRSDCATLARKAANLDKIASRAVSGYDGIYSRPKP